MSEPAIRLAGVGKMYKIFPSRGANLLDALGLPGGGHRYREFWALRGVDFEVQRGSRLGIIGRNGAGKSTLLKLITGNIVPTEGALEVRGDVQALLEAGAGFHPEFSGEDNIRAALTLQGVPPGAMPDLVDEIAEFTELGEFLGQPFRTYSAGMQARLAFATATAVKPDILIVDEMLSAGDAYFSVKAGERMRGLVDSGATLLLVSHSLDHVTMFCDQAIWIDRGRIVKRGGSMEVTKAYQQFTRVLDERRLTAKNRKIWEGTVPSHALDAYAETLDVRISVAGDDAVDVDRVRLVRDGMVEEEIAVGDAQDADNTHAAYVALEGGDWTSPVETERGLARSLRAAGGGTGSIAFNLYAYFGESKYAVELEARGSGQLQVEVLRAGVVRARLDEELGAAWSTHTVTLLPERAQVAAVGAAVSEADYDLPSRPSDIQSLSAATRASNGSGEIRHWPGEGTITIDAVALAGRDGEQAVFHVGTPLTVTLDIRSHATGTFPLTPAVVLYRLDGTRVSSHVGPPHELELEAGDSRSLRLHFERLNLGDGHYILSAALYRNLVQLGASETYDLVDRSYEFEVVGNDPFHGGVFHHPAEWILR